MRVTSLTTDYLNNKIEQSALCTAIWSKAGFSYWLDTLKRCGYSIEENTCAAVNYLATHKDGNRYTTIEISIAAQ